MALYVGAIAISLARRGWLGSLLLGLVLAAALKPFVGTYLLWLRSGGRPTLSGSRASQ